MPNSFTLNSGRLVIIDRLTQTRTYKSLLLGVPNTNTNKALIESLRGRIPSHVPSFVIEPQETTIEQADGTISTFLPRIAVVAGLIGDPLVDDSDVYSDGSHLALIWFQNEWAFPLESGILEKIEELNWDEHALNFGW